MIEIDRARVQDLADSFRALVTAGDFAQQITPRVNASNEAALRSFLWASTILHSTKGGLKGYFDGKFYKGWDYLLRAFCYAAEDDESLVSVEFTQQISPAELLDLLTRYSTETQVDLPDYARRSQILNRCALQIQEFYSGSITKMLEGTLGYVEGENGAYVRLGRLDAFQDPLRKKSSAFLMTVHFSGIWTAHDQESIWPMIDYHRMRLLCRTGCISVTDSELRKALIEQSQVSPAIETSIREAAADICKLVVELTQIPMFEFDVLLWAHARSCCRNFPVCISGRLENDSFYSYIEKDFAQRCEFQDWCPGYRNPAFRDIWEPMVATEHY